MASKKQQAIAAMGVLSRMDGHGIYSVSIISDLPDELRAVVPVFTEDETMQTMNARGLGGELTPTGGNVVWGYTTAAALARVIVGDDVPSGRIVWSGRGSAFRADVAAIFKVAKDEVNAPYA